MNYARIPCTNALSMRAPRLPRLAAAIVEAKAAQRQHEELQRMLDDLNDLAGRASPTMAEACADLNAVYC